MNETYHQRIIGCFWFVFSFPYTGMHPRASQRYRFCFGQLRICLSPTFYYSLDKQPDQVLFLNRTEKANL